MFSNNIATEFFLSLLLFSFSSAALKLLQKNLPISHRKTFTTRPCTLARTCSTRSHALPYNTCAVRCVCVVLYNDFQLCGGGGPRRLQQNIIASMCDRRRDRSRFPYAMDGVIYARACTVAIQKTRR